MKANVFADSCYNGYIFYFFILATKNSLAFFNISSNTASKLYVKCHRCIAQYSGSFEYLVIYHSILKPGKRRYQILVQLGGLIRAALVGVFFYFVAKSGIFSAVEYGAGWKEYVNGALFSTSFVLLILSALSMPSFGFEMMGYAKWQSLHHIPLSITSLLGVGLSILPRFFDGMNGGYMLYLAAGIIGGFIIITALLALIRAIIAQRNCMHDEILDALSEGFPLK